MEKKSEGIYLAGVGARTWLRKRGFAEAQLHTSRYTAKSD